MGLEASLRLLDLSWDATIDDANQAYAYLHRMIDLFHQESDAGGRGDRQDDMDLLTCAYEKALAYLSDRDPQNAQSAAIAPSRATAGDGPQSTDLHFTINVSADGGKDATLDDVPPLTEAKPRTVEDAISITSRRLNQTEAALPGAQQAVKSAMEAVAAANRRQSSAKQARMIAMVAAKSKKTRALLLENEAKRAMNDAIAVAERARDRVAAARQAAKDAAAEVKKAHEQARRVRKAEETAAAAVVCAEDRLEKERARLKALTHTLVEARDRMRMFRNATAAIETQDAEAPIHPAAVMPNNCFSATQADAGEMDARQQVMADLLEIEASLNARKEEPMMADGDGTVLPNATGQTPERRRHQRIIYPLDQCPLLSVDGQTVPILDLSSAGMRLAPKVEMVPSRIVRGVIVFSSRSPVRIAGKVVRQDDAGLGLKLVTRIGNHILDQERVRLSSILTPETERFIYSPSKSNHHQDFEGMGHDTDPASNVS